MNVSNSDKPKNRTVMIGDRLVGGTAPAFVIAEAGVNHDGSVERAIQLVDAAVESGADAVKFQIFRADQLATADAPCAAYQQRKTGHESQAKMLLEIELGPDDFASIKTHCHQRSIQFLATPFALADLEQIVALDASAIKIASTDLNNVPLLESAARTGLTLIVSTGASLDQEIRASVRHLHSMGAHDRVVLLHCVSAYPTPIDSLNLRAIATLRRVFMNPSGLSDHSTSIQAGAWAVAAGACVIEKHLTLDRRAMGPDHAMSLEPSQFNEYVREIRAAESALGKGDIGMAHLEMDVRRVARKSIVTSSDVTRGARFSEELITCKRPGTGISPMEWHQVVGRIAATNIPADTVLTWEMLA